MAIHVISGLLREGIPGSLSVWTLLWTALAITAVTIIKWYSTGAINTSERNMHGKIVLVTGGTSGIGAAAALCLARQGAQIILLVHQSAKDVFLVEYVEDMREQSGNELIYAEQVNLSSLYSIRQFATKWIDNAPPRRLDMILLCAATMTPPGKSRKILEEGLEETWMVNYLANFHLLNLLSPAIRAQPPDRDVRIIFASCSCYEKSPPIKYDSGLTEKDWSPTKAYAQSKLALNIFALEFQKRLAAYKRPDGAPMNAHVIVVDPGYSRTPGMRRWLTRGTLWGLGVYLSLWHLAWMLLKNSENGAQSILYAAMEAKYGRGSGGKFLKECREIEFSRSDIKNETISEALWSSSEKLINSLERKASIKRAFLKDENKKTKLGKTTHEKNTQ